MSCAETHNIRTRQTYCPVPTRRALRRLEAAEYIGVGATKFDQLVADGRMPNAVKIDGQPVWDVRSSIMHLMCCLVTMTATAILGTTDLVKLKVKYVVSDTDRNGNVRLYYREPGKRKERLRAAPGPPEFFEELSAAKNSSKASTASQSERVADNQFLRWLVTEYKKSAMWSELSEGTRKDRARIPGYVPRAARYTCQ